MVCKVIRSTVKFRSTVVSLYRNDRLLLYVTLRAYELYKLASVRLEFFAACYPQTIADSPDEGYVYHIMELPVDKFEALFFYRRSAGDDKMKT